MTLVEEMLFCSITGNGRFFADNVDALTDIELDELITALMHMPIRAKILLRKLGVSDIDYYTAEEEFFEKTDRLHDYLLCRNGSS